MIQVLFDTSTPGYSAWKAKAVELFGTMSAQMKSLLEPVEGPPGAIAGEIGLPFVEADEEPLRADSVRVLSLLTVSAQDPLRVGSHVGSQPSAQRASVVRIEVEPGAEVTLVIKAAQR